MGRNLTIGSLFSGIGGFDLGFQRAGFDVCWQVEIDPFCRAVLAKHWPQVARYEDVRTVGAELGYVDVICGGFPCQDISVAGNGAGIDGERSGLWFHFDRLIGELRPRYVVVENVSALLGRGIGRVLGDLSARGFDAEWDCLPAAAFGAPHRRDRVWIVAYTNERRREVERLAQSARLESSRGDQLDGCGAVRELEYAAAHVAYVGCERLSKPKRQAIFGTRRWEGMRATPECGAWDVEPDVGRVAHGVPARVDRLRSLGNALVPQIAQFIAERIKEAES